MTTSYFANLIAGGAPEKSDITVADILSQTGESLKKKKEVTIINIARHLAKIYAIPFTGATQEDALAFIRSQIPSPIGKHVKANVDAQTKFCVSLANAINSEYAREIIDLKETPKVICEKVEGFLKSISATVGSELVAVRVDLKRIIGNIEAMLAILEKTEGKIFEDAKNSDVATTTNTAQLNVLYKAAMDELQHHVVMLKNLLKITETEPAAALSKLLSETPEFKNIIENANVVGTEGFGGRIVAILYGMGDVATKASIVGEALKKIGISIEEYKKLPNVNKLTEAAYKAFEARNKKPKADEISEFVAALETLRNHQYMHKQISDEFAKNKKGILGGFEEKWNSRPDNISGGCGCSMAAGGDEDKKDAATVPTPNTVVAPAVGGSVYKTDSKTKRVERVEKTKDALMRDFAMGLDQKYDAIAAQILALANALKNNTEIFQLEEYGKFRDQIIDLQNTPPMTADLMYALTTARLDLQSKQNKANYLGQVALIRQLIAPFLTNAEYGSAFAALDKAFAAIPEYIDNFTERYLTALTEVAKPTTDIAGGCVENKTTGGSETGQENLAKAITTLKYYENSNKLRRALRTAKGELKNYTQDYEKILGEAMAIQTANINKDYKDFVESQFQDEKKNMLKWLDDVKDSKNQPANMKDRNNWFWRKAVFDEMRELYEHQHSSRIEFIKTIEALDLYMKNFTDAIHIRPEEAMDVVNMLKTVEIASKWQNEKSGDNLAKLFETFPINPREDTDLTTPAIKVIGDYVKILTGATAPAHVGNITNKTVRAKMVEENAKRAVASVKVLSNILSIFSKIGAKSVAVQDLMPIPTMLANFAKYLVYSAIEFKEFVEAATASGISEPVSISMIRIDKSILIAPPIVTIPPPPPPPSTISTSSSSTSIAPSTISASLASLLSSSSTTVLSSSSASSSSAVNPQWANKNLMQDTTVNRKMNTNWTKRIDWTLNNLFVSAIKAMMAKVLTLTGLYGALEKPITAELMDQHKFAIDNPLRVVLGAAENEIEINSNLTELYIRLPLIAEYYRSIFTDPKQEIKYKDVAYRISLVPEIQSLWSPFIKLIFVDMRYNGDSPYTRNQLNQLITEINIIAPKYENDAYKCMVGFRDEMNRRYGLIQADELNTYEKAKEKRKQPLGNDRILDDMFSTDIMTDVARMSLPSDRYDITITQNIAAAKTPELRDVDLDVFNKMVEKFRSMIDDSLTPLTANISSSINYFQSFSQYKKEMKNATTNAERFNILENVMHGYERFRVQNTSKALIWHECILWPISVIEQVLKLIKSMHDKANSMVGSISDPIEMITTLSSTLNNIIDVKIQDKTISIDMSAAENLLSRLIKFVRKNIDKFRAVIEQVKFKETENKIIELDDTFEKTFTEENNYVSVLTNKLSENWSFITTHEMPYGYICSLLWRERLTASDREIELGDTLKKERSRLIAESKAKPGDRKIAEQLDHVNKLIAEIETKPWLKWPFQFIPPVEEPRSEADRSKLKSIAEQMQTIAKTSPSYDAKAVVNWSPYSPIYNDLPSNADMYMQLQREYIRLASMNNSQPSERHAWYSDPTVVRDKSINGLIGSVNRLLSRYLYACFDHTTGKVYKGAISGIASTRSNEIMSGKAINDMSTYVAGVPAPNTIIYASLATAIRNIMTLNDKKTNLPMFAYTSLIDVPQHIKDHMRASLPTIDRMFQHVSNYATMLKRMLNFFKIKDTDTNVVKAPGPGWQAYPQTKNELKLWWTNVIEEVISIVATIRKSISDTRKELSDDPQYMEVYPGFFREFVAQNKKQPIVLPSQLTLAGNDVKYTIPYYSVGSPEMKYIYATRGVIGNPALPDKDAFNMRSLLESYNGTVNTVLRIDPDEFTAATMDELAFIKMGIELNTFRYLFGHDLFSVAIETQITKDLTETLAITSNVDTIAFTEKIKGLTTSESSTNETRTEIRKHNMIDLGLMPFNIHAIARNVPLAFLFNYAYTFDKIIGSEKYSELTAITKFPYIAMNPFELANVINGTSSYDGLAHTKYVNKEVWLKAACQETKISASLKNDGLVRMDTVLVRNLMFLCHIHRFIRYWLNQKLVAYHEPNATGIEILSDKLIIEQ